MKTSARLYGITVPLQIDVAHDGRVTRVSAPDALPTYQNLVAAVGKQIEAGKPLMQLLHRNVEMGDLIRFLMDLEDAAAKPAAEKPKLRAVK